MNDFDTIIRSGNVVLKDGVSAMDIGIKDGKIKEITGHLHGTSSTEIQAEGQFVFPGMIDVHVHINEPGREDWEGFTTGGFMMASGGCTTYFDMPLNGIPSTTTREALLHKAEIAEAKSTVDVGLWGGLVPGNKEDLADLAKEGVVGFKAFLSASGNEEFEAVDDLSLLTGMREIARLNKVLALHAESDTITKFLTQEKVQANLLSPDDYAESRPIIAEVEAVERALHYAELTGCPLHFVHISSAQAIEKIEQAKQKGMDVTVETCAHYLLFNHHDLVEKGAIAKCAPPLREKEEQQRLIELLKQGKFDMVSSDHSPCPFELKDPKTHHLFEAWGGINGGQFTLLAMIELAIKHHIPFPKIAAMTASNPASRFGLADIKGEIKVGLDADLALVSLDQHHTVKPTNFFAKHNKQSVYMGHTFPCRIMKTFNRGTKVYEDGQTEPLMINGVWKKGK